MRYRITTLLFIETKQGYKYHLLVSETLLDVNKKIQNLNVVFQYNVAWEFYIGVEECKSDSIINHLVILQNGILLNKYP